MPPFSKVEASKKHLLHETMQVALFFFFCEITKKPVAEIWSEGYQFAPDSPFVIISL